MICIWPLIQGVLLIAALCLTVVTLFRWFEQITEAVDLGWWNKVIVLIVIPPSVWLFPGRVPMGRPMAVPHHEPVLGFGAVPTKPKSADGPPPGTPKEFLGMPVIPPKIPKPTSPGPDPEKLARLKQKMRDQGMLPPGDS